MWWGRRLVCAGPILASWTMRASRALCLLLIPLSPLLAGAASAQTCDGTGWRLRACLRAAVAPTALLDADAARRALFETIDVQTRLDSTLVVDSTFVEADSTWEVEETWETFTVRFVRALDGPDEVAPDADQADALGWTVWAAEPDAREPDPHAIGLPLPADDLPAPVNDHLDVHAAWPSRSGGGPTDDMRGDVARGALYVRTVYPLHVEAAGPWPASGVLLSADLPALLAWHQADPPDDHERERTVRAGAAQGSAANPYVLDPGLVARAFPPRPSSSAPLDLGALWVNEVHATNDGPDSGEGVEVAGPAGTDLLGHRLVFYGGHGEPYDPYDPTVSAAPALSGALPIEGVLGAAWLPARGLWNRCNGVALVDPDGRVSHFLSYGGCRFNAVAGPVRTLAALDGADDPAHPDSLLWTTPVRGSGWRPVQEWTRMPAGYSLQLTGAGTRLADFAWGGPHHATPGRLGDYQAGGGARQAASNPTSGWTAGDPVPLGLMAPAVDDGPNQDAPWHGDTTPPCHCLLALGPPAPNPVRQGGTVRLAFSTPPGARLSVTVYDALGRSVVHLDAETSDGTLDLDTSTLAVGTYAVRVTATGSGASGPPATRRFAVVR